MKRTREQETKRRKTIAARRRHDHLVGPGFGPEDLIWCGEDGNLSFDAYDRQRRTDDALSQIVTAIVVANGEEDTGRRRDTAIHALLGTKLPVGAPTAKEDDAVLLILGRAVFLQEMGYAEVTIPMTEHIKNALAAAGLPHVSEDRVRHLREKFDLNRDEYLYRASNVRNETDSRRDEAAANLVEVATRAIKDIGIWVTLDRG